MAKRVVLLKKAIYDGTNILKIREVDIPSIGDDDILVKVDSAAICGTDIHILHGDFVAEKNISLCHEFSGYVEEI